MPVVCSLDRDGFVEEQRGHEMFGECTCKSVLILNTVAIVSHDVLQPLLLVVRSLDRDEFVEEHRGESFFR